MSKLCSSHPPLQCCHMIHGFGRGVIALADDTIQDHPRHSYPHNYGTAIRMLCLAVGSARFRRQGRTNSSAILDPGKIAREDRMGTLLLRHAEHVVTMDDDRHEIADG